MSTGNERGRLADGGANVIAGSLGRTEATARALLGEPAFLRRARTLERRIAQFLEALEGARFACWCALLPLARRLDGRPCPDASRADWLAAVLHELRRHPRYDRVPAAALRSDRRALRRFERLVEQANARWSGWLESVPLHSIQRLQADFNRYYPIEREVALRGARAADFEPVVPLERGALFERFPALPAAPPAR